MKFANLQATSYNDYPTTIKTQIGAGGGPDVMVLLDQDFFQLEKVGALAPPSLTKVTLANVWVMTLVKAAVPMA